MPSIGPTRSITYWIPDRPGDESSMFRGLDHGLSIDHWDAMPDQTPLPPHLRLVRIERMWSCGIKLWGRMTFGDGHVEEDPLDPSAYVPPPEERAKCLSDWEAIKHLPRHPLMPDDGLERGP